MTVAACAGSDGATEAAAATPTTDVPAAPDGTVPPAVTRSREAGVVFDWVPFDDAESYTRTALPEGAEPIENELPGRDGATILSRGHVFEHADGVIGYELIDDYATGDDFTKLSAMLAASVDGTVRSIAPADVTQAAAADGEIVYGDDHLMLFRIVVVNTEGDLWSGFVGGPSEDRDRLESEFARLTLSLDMRAAVDWVFVTDEPSGVVAPFRSAIEPRERFVTAADGSSVPAREYADWNTSSGVIVIDAGADAFTHEEALAARAEDLDGEVQSPGPSDVVGHEAVQAEILDRGWIWVHRVVVLDEHVVVIYAGNLAENVSRAREWVEMVSDAATIP
ncbi:hypothetical protein E1212_16855 [Jiangella ureilytica]|uniref:Uncharacterized protein n=1 Tax=Jiangella ureilytica TaxID=2530374 RepID=A0A4R4RMB3_9ACTN|nr:hypothetical protein [Jiangella ureilytica]TDC49802.1 hypothetical protein E1212_16855 [Jiangella ureilytica]